MKIAEISPVFKKLDNTCKGNYQPVSTLCNFTYFFESIVSCDFFVTLLTSISILLLFFYCKQYLFCNCQR